MKVYLHYEEPAVESERMTIKLTLPKSWIRGATSQLIASDYCARIAEPAAS